MIAAIAMVALVAVLCVTFSIFEPDFWEHLLVGRVIWDTRSVPAHLLWTWPTYDTPGVTPSWLFRALIWPFWSVGGVVGLFVWRWLTTLLTFGLLWAAGRRMGGHGFAALLVLVPVATAYQSRSQIRPETLVAVLVALEIWILETRRHGGADRSLWIIPIAWVWANAHISFYLGFVFLGAYLLDDALGVRWGESKQRRRWARLALIAAAALAVSFVNPFGWRALWEPVDFFLHLRDEPFYRNVRELLPLSWRTNLTNGFVPLLVTWPVLILWRLRGRRFDAVEIVLCAMFTAMALSSRRFIGFYVVGAAPFLMRDVQQAASAARPFLPRIPLTVRAGVPVLLCLVVAAREARRPWPPVGVSLDEHYVPIRACDFIAEHGLRGRFFSQFYVGGYLLYRFWPDQGRLPFMDIHFAGGPGVRSAYLNAISGAPGWHAEEERWKFDVALLDRKRGADQTILDVLDADPAWALVFIDDAAALYVRRRGPTSRVAERFGYRCLPGGTARVGPLGAACARDSSLRAQVATELRRAGASSPWNSWVSSLLGSMALTEGRMAEGSALLRHALDVDPWTGRAHERLGMIALANGEPRDALREFERERSAAPFHSGLALRFGQAWRRLGEDRRAREWYRRELRLDPSNQEAADSLRALGP